MMRMLALLGVWACLAGCQTTGSGSASGSRVAAPEARNEKLLLRVDQIVGTYGVSVQRAVLKGRDPEQKDQWTIIGRSEVEGYPGTFRSSDGFKTADRTNRETFLLDGNPVAVSQAPGTHLIVKVVPEHQNTARVVGVFVQVTSENGLAETFSMPFDLKCDVGRIYEVYSKTVPVEEGIEDFVDLYSQLD